MQTHDPDSRIPSFCGPPNREAFHPMTVHYLYSTTKSHKNNRQRNASPILTHLYLNSEYMHPTVDHLSKSYSNLSTEKVFQ